MTNWASVSDIRRICGVSTTDFTDAQIQDMISVAQTEINSKLISRVVREPVYFIDNYRQNKLDGTNTTFFIKNWRGNYLADYNYDNDVTVNDVSVILYDQNTQTETVYTPASIDIPSCSFTLTTAPSSSVNMYVTYAYAPLDPVFPNPFLIQCVSYLAGSYLFIGNDGFKIKFGNVSIEPGESGGKGKQLYDQYQELLNQLIVNSNGGALFDDVTNMDNIPLRTKFYGIRNY